MIGTEETQFIPCPLNHKWYCEIKFKNYCYGCELYSRATDSGRAKVDALLEEAKE